MSEKLSERMLYCAQEMARERWPVSYMTMREYAAEVATLERALAEMTRQRDEALKKPTADELREAVWNPYEQFQCEEAVKDFAAQRRKRILGDA